MDKNEQLKVIALLAVIGLEECIELEEYYEDHLELINELYELTNNLNDAAVVTDNPLRETRVEILQAVINFIKGLQ